MLLVQLNSAELQDSIFNYGQEAKEHKFFTSQVETYLRQAETGTLRRTLITMHNNIVVYNREVHGVLDFIGDVGGLSDGITYIMGAILMLLGLLGYDPLLEY